MLATKILFSKIYLLVPHSNFTDLAEYQKKKLLLASYHFHLQVNKSSRLCYFVVVVFTDFASFYFSDLLIKTGHSIIL